jgi:CRISPR-associated endonuclease Cas1
MTASHTLTPSPILEQIPKHGSLFMSGYGMRLQVQHGHLCADWGVGRDRYNIRLSRVNRDLKRIIVVGSGGFATFDALRMIADIGASLIFLDGRGKLLFASTPTAPSGVRLRRAQCLALENGTALKLSRELISQKIDGQAAVVRDMLDNSVAAEAILRFKAELAEANDIDAVRLVEAIAAKMYWRQWADVPIRWVRKDESRIATHWQRFTSRISQITQSPRLATNPVNACMNLLHGLCEAECRIALITVGLDPEVGLMHRDLTNRPSLANDLQEVLRPSVDSFVLHWIQTELFRKADFWEDRNGNCRIASPLAKKLCETADTWRRLVAPAAEWIAQALWNSCRNLPKREQVLTTRLTQRRKSEGRGNTFELKIKSIPRPTKICEVCGAEGVKSRYCKVCAVEAARENMAQVALIGHSRPKSKRVKDRISKRISDHAVANTWWDSKSLPSWLTDEYYVQNIQPLLSNKKVREIAAATQVSQAYAAFIRSGKRRPHPRHWQSLAELVGVSSESHNAAEYCGIKVEPFPYLGPKMAVRNSL